jgi:lysophospholipase L1-like esterase
MAGLVTLIGGCGATTLQAKATGPIVAIGDSLTFGYGAPSDHSYPADMARNLGIQVINAGLSGTTAHEGLYPADESAPLPPDLQLPALLDRHPRAMVVEFGAVEANNAWPIARTVADLDRLLARIASRHVPIVLVGVHVDCTANPCTIPSRTVYGEEWDAALAHLARRYHAGRVLDVQHGFTSADHTDWIHCNAQGYQRMARRIEPGVRSKLGG